MTKIIVKDPELKLYQIVEILSVWTVDDDGEVVKLDTNKCIGRKLINDD